jgi:hypothetical protein
VVDLAKDYSMRRFQLSSVLFLVAIVALACALFIQQRRAALRERQLRAELAEMSARSDMLEIVRRPQASRRMNKVRRRRTATRASSPLGRRCLLPINGPRTWPCDGSV